MRRQIEALTATRGIAALLVVVFHYGCLVPPFEFFEHFFRSGNLAVGYFFVLSGFVLYWAYKDRTFTYGAFIRKRFARIAPAYYIALLLAISLPLYALWKHHTALPNEFGKQVALNTTFIQAFFPGNAQSINSPAWSLSIEMFFYFLFPVLFLFAKKNNRAFIILVTVYFILSQAVHFILIEKYHPAYPSPIHEFIFYYPLFHLNEFLIGMIGAHFLSVSNNKGIRLPAVFLFVLIVLLVNYIPSSVSLHNGLLAPLYLLLIMSIAKRQPAFLKTRILVFLGEISYGIYILQEPLHAYSIKLNTKFFHLPDALFFYSYICLLLLSAAGSYYIIEKPLGKMLAGKT